jgi:hypothetical protein
MVALITLVPLLLVTSQGEWVTRVPPSIRMRTYCPFILMQPWLSLLWRLFNVSGSVNRPVGLTQAIFRLRARADVLPVLMLSL